MFKKTSRVWWLALMASLFLGACLGDGGNHGAASTAEVATENGNPEPELTARELPPASPLKPYTLLDEVEVEYADVARRDLSDLGFPSDLSGDAVSVVEGTARDLRLWDGGIRFITPGDPGYDTRVTLRVDLADRTVDMPVRIRSLRPTTISHESEVDEFGNFPHPSPPLRVKGLGPGNALLGGELSFSIEGSPPLDPRASGATAYDQDDKRLYDLADLWSYDPMANALTLSAESVETLLARLPSAEFIFSIGMSGEDADFNHVYTLLAHKPVASVSGQVVDGQGRVQTQLLGREVALRGLGNNGTRRVATIDARGEFSFPHVIQGMYFVVLLDPFLPDAWMTTLSVRPGSRHEEVSLVLQPVGNIYPAPVNADRLKPLSVSNTEAGAGSVAPSCSSPDKDGVIFRVAAGAQEQDIPYEVAFVLPKGTQRAGVRVSVTTAEFPEYTTVKSTFNDTWSYKLTGLLKEISNSGRVNVTHAHQGTVRKTYCIDVSGLTRSADSKVSGLLNARNVGDGMLPTAVILRIAPQCDDMLRVTVANMKSPNVKGFHTNRPLNSQKKGGPYLSVPLMSAVTDWGMPVDMKFEPADTQLKKARIGLLRGDILHMSDVDVLDKGYLVGKGHFRFKDLIIPVFGIERFNGTAQLVMELTGEREGKKLTSIPEDDEPVIFNGGASNFIPLFLAGDYLDVFRRYGSHSGAANRGGDSWATDSTSQWLTANAFRFDDISSLHIAQLSSGRSVLDHAGHNDGVQLDIRYADGLGGYSEALGGANNGLGILALLKSARSEVDLPVMTPRPQIAAAVAWVKANRDMAEQAASSASSIFMGAGWVRLALQEGQFPDGTPMPGLSRWETKPGSVRYLPAHQHHWHIALKL